ncbi:Aminotransferase-like, plant mobile domain [Sesbania bispinosa]|nr:Aminotransferase-like, plant mobile domain [Sesbania bispinosa]
MEVEPWLTKAEEKELVLRTCPDKGFLRGTDNGVQWLRQTTASGGSAYGLVSVWLKEEVQEVRVHPTEVEVMQKSESGLLHLLEHVEQDKLSNLCSRMTQHPQRKSRNRLFTREVLGIPLCLGHMSLTLPPFMVGRGDIKVITHGRKLKRPANDYVRDIVDDSGLGPLVEGAHSLVDRIWLSAFFERWHKDTSSFHLPVGEMTITLDDVNNLLHIPIHGRFFFLPSLVLRVVSSVGISGPDYLGLAVALAYLYEQLNEASLHQTHQLAGYSTLFQAWILEHFPHVTHGERSPDYVKGMPLSRRLRPHRPVGDIVNVRQYLDRICHSDIIWTSYITHRAYRPFHDVYWYYGSITSGGAPLPHLPDWLMFTTHDHLLDESRRGPPVTHVGECTHGYLDWFRLVSHPYLIKHKDRVHDPLPHRVPTFGGSQDIPSGTPRG